MFETFKTRAQAVSARVHRVPDRPAALALVVDLLRGEGVSAAPGAGAVWAPCRFLDGVDRVELARRAPGLCFDVTRAAAAAARVGVSQMDWAIANTGTLVQSSADPAQRLASSLPMAHVALASTRRIAPDLASLLREMPPQDHPYLAFITGPSRTADIERVLTIGVHGPERLEIVFVDEP